MRCRRCGSSDVVLFKDTHKCNVCDSTNIIAVELSRNEQKKKSVSGLLKWSLAIGIALGVLVLITLVPDLVKAREKTQVIACANNLKQIGIVTRIYATAHQDRFPWQVSRSEGGCAESINNLVADLDGFNKNNGRPEIVDFSNAFFAMRSQLSDPRVLICPSDGSAVAANNWDLLSDKNISYKIGLEADEARPDRILSLCKHHSKNGLWIILLSDGSVQTANKTKLQQYWKDQSIKGIGKLNIP
jgi:hypothetical protein